MAAMIPMAVLVPELHGDHAALNIWFHTLAKLASLLSITQYSSLLHTAGQEEGLDDGLLQAEGLQAEGLLAEGLLEGASASCTAGSGVPWISSSASSRA